MISRPAPVLLRLLPWSITVRSVVLPPPGCPLEVICCVITIPAIAGTAVANTSFCEIMFLSTRSLLVSLRFLIFQQAARSSVKRSLAPFSPFDQNSIQHQAGKPKHPPPHSLQPPQESDGE